MWNEFYVYSIFSALPAAAGVTFTNISTRLDRDADFEWVKTICTGGNIRIKFIEETTGFNYPKIPCFLANIASNFVGTPYLFDPVTLPAGAVLTTQASDNSGAGFNMRLALHGSKKRPGNPPWGFYDPTTGKTIMKHYRLKRPAWYSTDRQTVAAGATIDIPVTVDGDAHFLVKKISGSRQGACLVSINTAERGQDWMNSAVHFDTIVGNAQFPNVLFSNRYIQKNSSIVVTIQNLDLVNANIIEILFYGLKLFE